MMNFIILVIGLNKIPMLLHFYAENIITTYIINITSDFLKSKSEVDKEGSVRLTERHLTVTCKHLHQVCE